MIYMQRHTMAEIVDHSRNIAFERSVKITGRGTSGGGGGLKSTLRGHNPHP